MTIEYLNSEQNVLITDTIVGVGEYDIYNTKMSYIGYAVQVIPTGGACTVAASNNGIDFVDWDNGAVAIDTIESCSSVSYIRVTNDTSTSTKVAIWGYR